MNDDQSFYEIHLETPHVVLVVLSAVVVGVVIFWLGVVIGKGRSEPLGGGDEWQAAVPADASTQAEAPPAGLAEQTEQPQAMDDHAGAAETGSDVTSPASGDEMAAPAFQPSEPVDEEPAPVAAQSRAGLPEPDASLASGWIVQVRSTPDKGAADSLQASLAAAGFPAFVVSADVSGETYYRVRIGRYGSRSDAETIEAALLSRADIDTTWVTEG